VQLPPPPSELERQANLLDLLVLDLAVTRFFFIKMHYRICHLENIKKTFSREGLCPHPKPCFIWTIPENESALTSVSPQRKSWLGLCLIWSSSRTDVASL